MPIKALLRRFIIIWAHTENTTYTQPIGFPNFFHDSPRIVASTTHQNRHSAFHSIDNKRLNGRLLIFGKTGGLSRSSENTEKVCAVVKLIVYDAFQRIIVNRSIARKRCNKGNTQAFKYIMCHKMSFFSPAKITIFTIKRRNAQ